MSAGTGARRVTALLRPSNFDSAVCRSCQENLSRRGYATAAASASTESPVPPSSSTSEPAPSTTSSALQPKYTIKAGLVLSRAPRITRDLTPFEKAFFFYQRRLNERLALPFTRYFYFKRNTPADVEWKAKYKERQTAARDIGKYNAYSKDAWNDELLVGAQESEPEHQIQALVKDAEFTSTEASEENVREEIPKPMPRVTEADRKGDFKSLDRLLQRTLYLLVQPKEEKFWRFPAVALVEKENLRMGAERAGFESAGPNMNCWMVGYHPIGHHVYNFPEPKLDKEAGVEHLGEKTFFLKGRILAGQADLTGNTQGIADFRWVAKDEIQKLVSAHYWSSIKNMLAER